MATQTAKKSGAKKVRASAGDISDEFKVTSASEWKADGLRKTAELQLPSGHTCKCARVNMITFMKAGKIPNSLRPLIDKGMAGKEVSQEEILDKLLAGDKEAAKNFEDMMTLVDAVVVDVMVEPKVVPAPKTEEERSDTLLHVDEIGEEDRMFIFSFATGGVRDLEPFRAGQDRNVEYIRSQQGGATLSE